MKKIIGFTFITVALGTFGWFKMQSTNPQQGRHDVSSKELVHKAETTSTAELETIHESKEEDGYIAYEDLNEQQRELLAADEKNVSILEEEKMYAIEQAPVNAPEAFSTTEEFRDESTEMMSQIFANQ